MKIKNPLFVVKDMEKSKFFYRHVLGLRTTLDLGAHVVLTGELALQSEDESMELVCKRFLDSGMTKEETAKRMGVPLRMVNSMEGRVGVIQEEQNRKREGE